MENRILNESQLFGPRKNRKKRESQSVCTSPFIPTLSKRVNNKHHHLYYTHLEGAHTHTEWTSILHTEQQTQKQVTQNGLALQKKGLIVLKPDGLLVYCAWFHREVIQGGVKQNPRSIQTVLEYRQKKFLHLLPSVLVNSWYCSVEQPTSTER